MKPALMRFWQEIDSEKVRRHLLVAGELSGMCEHCQQTDISLAQATVCPQCGTQFRYACVRGRENRREELAAVARLKHARPDLQLVEYDDVRRAAAKSAAHDLLG